MRSFVLLIAAGVVLACGCSGQEERPAENVPPRQAGSFEVGCDLMDGAWFEFVEGGNLEVSMNDKTLTVYDADGTAILDGDWQMTARMSGVLHTTNLITGEVSEEPFEIEPSPFSADVPTQEELDECNAGCEEDRGECTKNARVFRVVCALVAVKACLQSCDDAGCVLACSTLGGVFCQGAELSFYDYCEWKEFGCKFHCNTGTL